MMPPKLLRAKPVVKRLEGWKSDIRGTTRFQELPRAAQEYVRFIEKECGVPVTVHVAIGQDIIHEHPDFDGAATGAASYADFLVYTQSVCGLDGGVMLNIGTAVMGPEVYLKALTMARNVAFQDGRAIQRFTTGVFDLVPLDVDQLRREAPKTDPTYYFRPYKTILVRTVADGGESYYVQGDHRTTVPTLYHLTLEG